MNDTFVYRFDGRFDSIDMIGPVADGVRMDSRFSGQITKGELAGAAVTGIDYFRIRADGVGVVDGREVVDFGGARIAVRLSGYILPPEGMPVPSPEMMMSPEFFWPDVPFAVRVLATFETAAPALAHLNRLAVAHTGDVNMARGELHIDAWQLG